MTVRYGLEGRTVLITGAAGGIGQALARAFLAQGARLLLLDREAAPLDALVESLRSHQVHSAVCDLGSDAAVATVAAQVADRFGRLDVLVHNAGTEYPTPVDDGADDANARWAALLDNNVSGMWRLTRALLPLLPRGASVIHQSSIWGRIGVAGFSAYAASKHAVTGMTKNAALEYGRDGILTNAIAPGAILTPMVAEAFKQVNPADPKAVESEYAQRNPTKRLGKPEEVAKLVAFLLSEDNGYVSGQTIAIDGGESNIYGNS